MTEVNPIGTNNVSNIDVVKGGFTKTEREKLADKVLFNYDYTNQTDLGILSIEKAVGDIGKTKNLKADAEAKKAEFLKEYGNSPICNIGFHDLTEKETEFVLKIQDSFGNNNDMTVNEYLKSKNFNPKFLQLILDKGFVYNDENEDCKTD